MSTAAVTPAPDQTAWRSTPVTWRDIPPTLWVLAVAWSVACWALLAPWVPSWARSGDHWTGDTVHDTVLGIGLAIGPLLSLAVALAPLATLWRPWLGLLLGMVGLFPAWGTEGIAGQFSGWLALVGVAGLWTWHRGRVNWLPLIVAMAIPCLYCFSAGRYDVTLRGNTVESGYYAGTPGAVTRNAITAGLYVATGLLLVWLCWLVCRGARHQVMARRDLAAAQRAVAQQQAAVRSESAAVDERARLARDLHDIVAHRISLVAVRAETAPYKLPTLDEPTRDEFGAIATDARTALDEMRQVLGVLHRSQDAGVRLPQPGVDDIPALLEESRAAGTDVELTGALPDLTGTTGTIVYRVVQEALTNARRHGSGPVALDLRQVGEHVCVHAENPTDGPAEVVAGRGLTGMRERVQLVGGSLCTAVHDGRFVLVADVPTAEAATVGATATSDGTEPTAVLPGTEPTVALPADRLPD